ncbi:thioredoxin domain protein [Natrialba magadii ATCC 43099]|uniref:Alkyl hydroperoxide reductase/ thiol specific antioxidant/ Mal allergen n=1 Tax=Natrialba magadii (strain ATCC 43099 / DSM 3394 / CCM 3739 / CIP 104546 / IAM 13178 / JCM 8861 / NBRC 102185 / NCIMB 2190 / MS3) TaxID=547559 RepID=D3SY52_NATMM|nr:hypothetical protein [Natrialba magadii]ADD06023.1 thioredoxin domain protein [Natrialba magadii ATCC 43099]ELY30468.1 alkyl hydroperoxide reductase/ thiol specific antioxidant/ Mal allergen [Natrialba magadii ATCC 43099]
MTGVGPTRRELAAGTAGLGLSTLAGCLGVLESNEPTDNGDESESETDDNDDNDGSAGTPSLPIDVPTVDGPGSEAGMLTVPTDGILLINFTRLHCPTSEGLLETIGDARERLIAESEAEETDDDDGDDGNNDGNTPLEYTVGRGEDLTVISVVSGVSGATPTEEELGEWWAEHDGNWTVGIDEENSLFDIYGVRSAPATRIIDSEGELQWESDGGTATGSYVSAAQSALESNE